MARFDLAWPLAGTCAALLSALILGGLCAARGLPPWMALNATSHALHGAAAAEIAVLDRAHTGLGAAIHVVSCLFWAAVAVLMIRRAAAGGAWLAWTAGLATATMAGLVDYGLMPARLRPGWELVLPPVGVLLGLAALGAGLALGLMAARGLGTRSTPDRRRSVGAPGDATAGQDRTLADAGLSTQRPEDSALDRMRRPRPDMLDQRQQRVDPAGTVTADPNRQGNGGKQPGPPERGPESGPEPEPAARTGR